MTPAPASPWLSLGQASDYTQLSEPTLRRAVKAGALVAFRVNGAKLLRFRVQDLDAYLQTFAVSERAS